MCVNLTNGLILPFWLLVCVKLSDGLIGFRKTFFTFSVQFSIGIRLADAFFYSICLKLFDLFTGFRKKFFIFLYHICSLHFIVCYHVIHFAIKLNYHCIFYLLKIKMLLSVTQVHYNFIYPVLYTRLCSALMCVQAHLCRLPPLHNTHHLQR